MISTEDINKYAERLRGHQLLTEEILGLFRALGSQDSPDAVVVTKFFHPFSQWTWYATAYDEHEKMFFGLVDGFESELGYWSLEDISGLIKGLPFERDCYWKRKPLRDIQLEIQIRRNRQQTNREL